MRSRRKRSSVLVLDRRWLFGMVGIILLFLISVNCTLDAYTAAVLRGDLMPGEGPEADEEKTPGFLDIDPETALQDQTESVELFSDQLMADVGPSTGSPVPTHSSPTRISLELQDANLLDVLSMLAYKLDANVIFLAEPSTITIQTRSLSPLTTFQTILQKEGLDYLTLGDNYIVGQRERLYGDFANRMMLSRFSLFYVSASDMEGYLSQLGVPIQSLTVDNNQKAIWMQGTPMALGKAREIINTLDVMENASFAEGGGRKIRMPVATATGARAEEELEALIDLLSILLDGFRDGRTEVGWVTWDHPDPVPSIYMDWDNPIIKPYDIKMKITRDFNNDYSNQIRYLIAEGTPDNIDLVGQMIAAISGTPASPFSMQEEIIEDPELDYSQDLNDNNNNENDTVQWVPDVGGASFTSSYSVDLNAVPTAGGSLTGRGSYYEGASVTVTANPAEGYQFVRWIEGGAEVSTSRNYTFYIYNDRNLEAVFSKIETDTDEGNESEETEPNNVQ